MAFPAPLTAIFEQIVRNSLWASVLGILLALAWRWLPVRIRYGFGLLVLCRLLMPATPVSPWSAAHWWHGTGPVTGMSGIAPAAADSPVLAVPANAPADHSTGQESSPSPKEHPSSIPPSPSVGQLRRSAITTPPAPHWTMGLSAVVWLSGAVLGAARLIRRQRAFTRWWKARRTPASALWQDSLTDCLMSSAPARPANPSACKGTAKSGAAKGKGGDSGLRPACRPRRKPGRIILSRPMRIWQVPGLGSPLAVGILRPCILVPTGLDEVLNSSERAHILQHELAHHRHHDILWNLLLAAARVLHWFHPLVHPAATRLLHEREIQRDADAVQACARTGARIQTANNAAQATGLNTAAAAAAAAGYGATLLKLVTLLPPPRSASPVPQPSGSPILGKHHLKQRLTMIPQHTRNTTSPAARITFAATALTLAVLTFTQAEDKNPAVPPAPPSAPVPADAQSAPPNTSTPIQIFINKLNGIVIPRMQFSGANMSEAVAFLRYKSIEHDKQTSDPDRKGVDIILKGESTTPITCDLRNAGLIDALKTICELSGFRYRLEAGRIFVVRADLEDRSLLTRVFRIDAATARAMGWRPGKDTPFSQLLTSRFGLEFPEGSTVSLDMDGGRLIARLPMRELDELEGFLETSRLTPPVAGFVLTTAGIRESGDENAGILTESKFAEFLKTTAGQSPQTIIRLQCEAQVPYDQVTAILEKVRAAGLKNVDLAIRDAPRETPPAKPAK